MLRRSLRRLAKHRKVLGRVVRWGVAVYALISLAVLWFTERLWYDAVDRGDVFSRVLGTRVALGVGAAVVVGFLVWSTVVVARRVTPADRAFTLPEHALEHSRARFSGIVRRAPWLVGVIAALIAGFSASGWWREYLLWRHGGSFGSTDPVLGRDLGTYVFGLPFQHAAQGFVWKTVLWTLIVAVLAHYVYGGIRPQRRGQRISKPALKHLCVIAAGLALTAAWGAWLARYDLVVGGHGVVAGAGYEDSHVSLPIALAAVFVLPLVALVLLTSAAHPRRSMIAGALVVAFGLVAVEAVADRVVQRFVVAPDEAAKERPYLERSLEATRDAYLLDDVQRIGWERGSAGFTDAQRAEVERLPVWSARVLQQVVGSVQRFTPYYAFPSRPDVDRYVVNGELRQVLVGAREVSTSGLSGTARTWPNQHLVYTQGEGAVIARADASAGGAPELLLGDLPPRAVDPSLTLDDPAVAIGESRELDFAIGAAETGVPSSGFLRRLAFAWRFGDLNLLLSGAVDADARILYRRSVLERAASVVPFLTLEQDPYPVVADGRISWIVDAYTTTATMPYSIPTDLGSATKGLLTGRANRIRDAAKVVIDASTGAVSVYATIDDDPILEAWRSAFPELFLDIGAMPASLRAHLRFPRGLFEVISERYAAVHVEDADTFYRQSDAWQVARDPVACLNTEEPCAQPGMGGTYLVASFAGGERFLLTRPYTPIGQGRANLVGYLAVDAATGELFAIDLPAGAGVLGPEQAQAAINQDPLVSSQVSLWNQQHSRVIYGDLVGAPVGGSFVYIQALYLQAEGSDLPQLKRVVLLVDGQVAMGSDARDALAQLTGDVAGLKAELLDARNDVAACLGAGDDPCAQAALQRLESLLERLPG